MAVGCARDEHRLDAGELPTDAGADSPDANPEDGGADAGSEESDAGSEESDASSPADGGDVSDASIEDAGPPRCLGRRPDTVVCCAPDAGSVPLQCSQEREWVCPSETTLHRVTAPLSYSLLCGNSVNTAEVDIPCPSAGATSCSPAEGCCKSLLTFCTEDIDQWAQNGSCSELIGCDGPEDCAGGICCLTHGSAPNNTPAILTGCSTAPRCGNDQVQICNTAADCPTGKQCCATRVSENSGACLDECVF